MRRFEWAPTTYVFFLGRNKQNYPLIIIKYPPYLFHWLYPVDTIISACIFFISLQQLCLLHHPPLSPGIPVVPHPLPPAVCHRYPGDSSLPHQPCLGLWLHHLHRHHQDKGSACPHPLQEGLISARCLEWWTHYCHHPHHQTNLCYSVSWHQYSMNDTIQRSMVQTKQIFWPVEQIWCIWWY